MPAQKPSAEEFLSAERFLDADPELPLRERTRQVVSQLPTAQRIAVGAVPSFAGGLAGTALGGLLGGPPGALIGGSLGAFGGETLAQQTGLTEESRLQQVLAGLPIGPMAGAVGRGIKGVVTSFPGVRHAAGKLMHQQAQEAVETFARGARPSPSAGTLYSAAREAGGTINPLELNETRRALASMGEELGRFARVTPEGRQLRLALRAVQQELGFLPSKAKQTVLDPSGQPVFATSGPVDLEMFDRSIKFLNRMVRQYEQAGGERLGAAKVVREAMFRDLDHLAQAGGRGAPELQQAVAAARREFAADRFEQAVARFTKPTKGSGGEQVFNVTQMQTWLSNVTNPKHKAYDKNLTAVFGRELDEVKEALALANQYTTGSAAGPGSIVVRGRTTRAVQGMAAGLGLGGPVGAMIGAAVGPMAPEILAKALLLPGPRQVLLQLLRYEGGQLTQQSANLLWQTLRQAGAVGIEEGTKQLNQLQPQQPRPGGAEDFLGRLRSLLEPGQAEAAEITPQGAQRGDHRGTAVPDLATGLRLRAGPALEDRPTVAIPGAQPLEAPAAVRSQMRISAPQPPAGPLEVPPGQRQAPQQAQETQEDTFTRFVQERLVNHGHRIAVDGILGPQTKGALKAFQRQQGLTPDGIVGDRTLAALRAAPTSGVVTSGTTGEPRREVERAIQVAAKAQGIDEKLMRAIAKVESNFDHRARGAAGEIGALQMMPQTAKGLGYDPKALVDNPAVQAEASAKLLRQLQRAFPNDQDKIIAGYNAGVGNVFKAVRLAKEKGGDWRDHLPRGRGFDARAYLAKVRTELDSKPFNPPRAR